MKKRQRDVTGRALAPQLYLPSILSVSRLGGDAPSSYRPSCVANLAAASDLLNRNVVATGSSLVAGAARVWWQAEVVRQPTKFALPAVDRRGVRGADIMPAPMPRLNTLPILKRHLLEPPRKRSYQAIPTLS